jgi:Immunity protein family (Imm11)
LRRLRHLKCADAFALSEGREGLGPTNRALRVRSRRLLQNDLAIARAEHVPGEPIDFVRAEGHKPYDVIGTSYATLLLVSSRFRGVLRSHGFTGWTTFPVRIFLDDGDELDGYSGIAITGRCGPIDDNQSEKVTLPLPLPHGRARLGLRGLCFPPDTWDGSDLFTSEAGGAWIFVVERVKDALERAQLRNFEFERLSEIERSWRADGRLIESE